MQDPFDIEVNGISYAVFPEEDNKYTIFKEGEEFHKIQKDTEDHWLKLHPETELPLFDNDPEVNLIGRQISDHKEEIDEED